MLGETLRLACRSFAARRILRQRPAQILALQRKRLARFLAKIRAESPFYAERLRGVDLADFDLGRLPTLTKPEMMANFDRLVTDPRLRLGDLEAFTADPARLGQWYLGEYSVTRTSGTQGQTAVVVQDRAMMELLFALQLGRGGVFPATPAQALRRVLRRARLAVLTIGQGFYPSAAGMAYSPPALGAFVNRLWIQQIEPIEEVARRLNHFQPNILLAYANVLELLAHEELAGRLRLRAAGNLRQVIQFSEPLSEATRRLVERAFGLPVTNNYALGECMGLSSGCPQGHGMHLNADWAMLEVVDRQNRPVPPGQPGAKALVTNLYNTVQPFLRYEVEDVVTLGRSPCPCGNPLPLILKVEGRNDEILWVEGPEGLRPIHPYVILDVLDECPEVGLFQLVQTARNRLLLRVAPVRNRALAPEQLRARLLERLARHRVGAAIQVDVEVDEHLAPDPRSGKLRRITTLVGAPNGGAERTDLAHDLHAQGAASL